MRPERLAVDEHQVGGGDPGKGVARRRVRARAHQREQRREREARDHRV
ncbi:MAG: hypothetical protein O2979_07160 [Proteobacteria bacterium]|nr:hypothetical protein [Pseudomonadota bacterium]